MKTLSEHTFDDHACLTRRQVKDYLSAAMSPEEVAAAEQHFNSCPLCKEAMEGYLGHSDKALEVLAGLNNDMLNQQIGSIQQQMHEAKMVPILTKPAKRKKRAGEPPRLNSLVPVFVLVAVFALFCYEQGNSFVPYPPRRAAVREARPEKPLATAYAKAAPAPKVSSVSYPEEPVAHITKVDAPPAQPLSSQAASESKATWTGNTPVKNTSPHDTTVVRKPAIGATQPTAKRTTGRDTGLGRKTTMLVNQPPKPIEQPKAAATPSVHKPAFGPAEYGHDTPVIKQIATTPKAVVPKNNAADTGGGHITAPGD
jgi:hypothetical protein